MSSKRHQLTIAIKDLDRVGKEYFKARLERKESWGAEIIRLGTAIKDEIIKDTSIESEIANHYVSVMKNNESIMQEFVIVKK